MLAGIGNEEFGHECKLVWCRANYLDGHSHIVVYDQTTGRGLDAALYSSAFVKGRWAPLEGSGIDRTNITRDMVTEPRLYKIQWQVD